MAAQTGNGAKTALILHGITWALLVAILGLGMQMRNHDLDLLYQQVSEIRQIISTHMAEGRK